MISNANQFPKSAKSTWSHFDCGLSWPGCHCCCCGAASAKGCCAFGFAFFQHHHHVERAVPGRKSALSIRQMTVAMSAPQLPLSASVSAADPLPTLICCHPSCPSSRIISCCSFLHCCLGCLSYEDGAGLRPGTNVHMIQPAAHKKDSHTYTHTKAAHTSRTHTHILHGVLNSAAKS